MGYLEHLTTADLKTLAEVGFSAVPADGPPLAPDPGRIEDLLAHPAVYDRLFGAPERAELFVAASPFLVFAVLVHRAAADLARSHFVVERTGERVRLPVFDVAPLRDFLAASQRRFFLTEVLASYTKVQSGVVWVPSDRGWRRQRFSELDPIRFAALLDLVPEAERPGILRRLGDIALFLCGVFPDQVHRMLAGPVTLHRLQRLETSSGLQRAASVDATVTDAPAELLERLGQRWYLLAHHLVPAWQQPALQVVAQVGERFHEARRVLNFMTDHYLFAYRDLWFPRQAS